MSVVKTASVCCCCDAIASLHDFPTKDGPLVHSILPEETVSFVSLILNNLSVWVCSLCHDHDLNFT